MSILSPLMKIDRFIEKYDLDCTEGHRPRLGTDTDMRGYLAIEALRPRTRPQTRRGSMSAVCACGVRPWHRDMARHPQARRRR